MAITLQPFDTIFGYRRGEKGKSKERGRGREGGGERKGRRATGGGRQGRN